MGEPEYIDLTPEMRERLERFREQHEGEPLGKVATRMLFEDERVRIWELRLEPGEASDLHRHDHDYYVTILRGDLVAAVHPKQTEREDYVAKLPPGGHTARLRKGGMEWAVNVGDEPYHEILIELMS